MMGVVGASREWRTGVFRTSVQDRGGDKGVVGGKGEEGGGVFDGLDGSCGRGCGVVVAEGIHHGEGGRLRMS